MKQNWRKSWPKEHEGTRHRTGHAAKFKRPYRRGRKSWRELLIRAEVENYG